MSEKELIRRVRQVILSNVPQGCDPQDARDFATNTSRRVFAIIRNQLVMDAVKHGSLTVNAARRVYGLPPLASTEKLFVCDQTISKEQARTLARHWAQGSQRLDRPEEWDVVIHPDGRIERVGDVHSNFLDGSVWDKTLDGWRKRSTIYGDRPAESIT